jgi:hypothetical protein
MATADTLRLLRWHAGLEGDPLDPGSVSGATAAGRGLDAGLSSCLQALGVLNHELNGPRPSADTATRHDAVPRDVAYAVAEIARLLRVNHQEDAAWQVDTAWAAVLAGDIDDIAGHIAAERRRR